MAASLTVADDAPVIVEIAARFRMPTRRAARRVADRIKRERDAHVTVTPTRLLHRGGEWAVFVRLPLNRIGLERIRQVTDGFAELAEEFGGDMVWEATRPRAKQRPPEQAGG
jgi:hypothetical protein